MVETCAIAASKTGAVAAVSSIKVAAPVPELKGKTMHMATTIKVVAIIEWLKSISKHQVIKGTVLGDVVLKMSKVFDWPAEEISNKARKMAQEDKGEFSNQDADLLDKIKEGISGDVRGAIEDQEQQDRPRLQLAVAGNRLAVPTNASPPHLRVCARHRHRRHALLRRAYVL